MSENDLITNIEFIRSIALLYDTSGKRMTLLIPDSGKKENNKLYCSCSKGSYAKCSHAQELKLKYSKLLSYCNGILPDDHFSKSFFRKIFEPFIRVQPACVDNVKITCTEVGSDALNIRNSTGQLIGVASFPEKIMERFLGRIMPNKLSRLHFMRNAVTFIQTDTEKTFQIAGVKSQRQVMESSFWFLCAYHLYREYDEREINVSVVVDTEKACCVLSIQHDGKTVLSTVVPNEIVPHITEVFETNSTIHADINRIKGEHELFFRIAVRDSKTQGEIIPCVKIIDKKGEQLIDIDERFIFERISYLPSKKVFIRLTPDSIKLLACGWGAKRRLNVSEISAFLEENCQIFSMSTNNDHDAIPDLFTIAAQEINFARIAYPPIITTFDRVELTPLSLDNANCTLEISYFSNSGTVPLAKLLETKKKKNRFLNRQTMTVDMSSPSINSSLVSATKVAKDGTVTVARAALMRFNGSTVHTKITGDNELTTRIKDMFAFKPLRDFEPLEKFNGELREYQKNCVQWLLFLYDNSFGGLLCDEMGLGKTIEAIAFIGALREQRDCPGPHLVICPASVLEYWERQLIRFLPDIVVYLHYAPNRDNVLNDKKFDVLITTYGILRNDVELLSSVQFKMAIFDEVQQLKNSASVASVAANQLCASMKIGLTGTPIENSVIELRTLFNLAIPGIFSVDFDSGTNRFMNEQGTDISENERQSIRKVIEPFMMRRLKSTVLTELPSKIEETRYCSLMGNQAILYREVLEERGGPMLESLKKSEEPIPYVSFFALLSLLKQICNHPGSIIEKTGDYIYSESGKWELFRELLDESLGSGQKVVVFSQYLKMIDIITLHLDMLEIGYTVLTGKSKKRDALVQRFANDSTCRVFVCSLKAGGVGIDLTPASTVIHYDRWWNAAREDQATDRVHRFGQTRGVEVFKLITKDSIEERIDSIICRKRALSNNILHSDKPEELKKFTRDELIEILMGVKQVI